MENVCDKESGVVGKLCVIKESGVVGKLCDKESWVVGKCDEKEQRAMGNRMWLLGNCG